MGFACVPLAAAGCGGDEIGFTPPGSEDGGSDGGSSSSSSSGGASKDGEAPKPDGGTDPNAATYAVGGTVTGLDDATGLTLALNGGGDLAIDADGPFVFATKLASGASYTVTITAQPAGRTCELSASSGTVATSDVTDVVVNCAADKFTVGGTITGLASGASVTLENGGEALTKGANGAFAFPTPIATGTAYAVTVKTQPGSPVQVCTVTNGTGTMGADNVTDVAVACVTTKFSVGGTVSGLVGDSVTLQNNGGETITVDANGAFTFTTDVASGADYAVTVLTQPKNPAQSCTVTGGTGKVTNAAVTSVAVSCATNSYKIGGNLVGLLDGKSIELKNNGADSLTLTEDGSFQFTASVESGATYAVTVATQPEGQTCTVGGGTGTVGSAHVSSVVINCTGNMYSVGGTVTGLAGSLQLQNNGGDEIEVTSNTFAFPELLLTGTDYEVTISGQPTDPSQTCTITANASGTVVSSDVTDVTIACTTNTFKVGGTLTGLASGESVVLQNKGGDDLAVSANGAFEFTTPIASGQSYAVTVKTNPGNAIDQTCTVTDGSGNVGSGDVTGVQVDCTTNTHTVGGTITGLAPGAEVVLMNNGEQKTFSSNGAFAFPTEVESGATYTMGVVTQPSDPTQVCSIDAPTGTVGTGPVSVTVTCETQSFFIGGTLSGLTEQAGNAIELELNGVETITRTANGAFTFPTEKVLSGATYDVTIKTQPSNPAQTCTVSGSGNTVGGADVTSVVVNCAPDEHTIGGQVANLASGAKLKIKNGTEELEVTGTGGANTSFTFLNTVANGGSYNVSIVSSPSSATAPPATQDCTIVGTTHTGTVGTVDIDTVRLTCTTKKFDVKVEVSGYSDTVNVGTASGLVVNGGSSVTFHANETKVAAAQVSSGATYTLTLTQPTNPKQTCSVTSGALSGTVANGDITVKLSCVRTTATVTARVHGLANGKSITLRNNGGNNLAISGPSGTTSQTTGSFTTPVTNGGAYAVTLQSGPTPLGNANSSQECRVRAPSSGSMPSTGENVTVDVDCGRTCASRSAAGDNSSGSKSLQPGGQGGGTSFNAYCDMTYDSGGWTLLLRTTNGQPGNTSNSCTPAGTGGTNNCRLSDVRVTAFARLASRVHVREDDDTVNTTSSQSWNRTRWVTSTADSLPIQNLRALKVLNLGAVSAQAANDWTRSQDLSTNIFTFTQAPNSTDWPSVYQARNNDNGFQFYGDNADWNSNNNEPARVYVK